MGPAVGPAVGPVEPAVGPELGLGPGPNAADNSDHLVTHNTTSRCISKIKGSEIPSHRLRLWSLVNLTAVDSSSRIAWSITTLDYLCIDWSSMDIVSNYLSLRIRCHCRKLQ